MGARRANESTSSLSSHRSIHFSLAALARAELARARRRPAGAMALRRWKPFLGAFAHIDAAIEAAPDGSSRDEFRSARARIVEMLCDATDDDGVAEGLCLLLDDAMAESLVTLRTVAAEKRPGLLASGELVGAVGALMTGHASERVRGLARDVVRGWRAGVEEELARARAAMDVLDGLSAPPPCPEGTTPAAIIDSKKQAKIRDEQPLPKKTAAAPVGGSGRTNTANISDRSPKQSAPAVVSNGHVKTPANMAASTGVLPAQPPKKTPPAIDARVVRSSCSEEEKEKMESTKRKLHERYQEAEEAKRRRTIRVIKAPRLAATARAWACSTAVDKRRFPISSSLRMV
ncbi:hypothetical protein ACP70R_013577 [Stipagrostis hirtigluma subsp. patula]